jgi:hypothetical protein
VLCTYAVATHQLYSQPRLHAIAEVAPSGGGVNQLICRDRLMAFSVASGGTAGNMWWIALRRTDGAWRVVHVGSGYKLGILAAGRDVIDTQPVFRKHDANCCPSGGYDHRRWHWNGRALALVRSWHTRSP